MKRIITYLFTLLLLMTPAMAQKKQSVDDLKKQQAKNQKELEATKKMLSETKRNETATLNKLNIISKDIQERKELINTLTLEIDGLDQEMTILSFKQDSLGQVIEKLKADYAKMVRESHYANAQASPILFILSAKDFQQMVHRVRYIHDIQVHRRMLVNRIHNSQNELMIQGQMLQANKADKEQAMKTQEAQQQALQRDEQNKKTMLESLKKKEKQLADQQKKQQKQANDLNRKIEQLIKQEIEKANKANKSNKGGTTSKTSTSKGNVNTLTKEQAAVAGGFAKNKGRLPWPVEKGYISGHYGVQNHPTLAKVTINNKGIYIQTTKGAKARAVYEGEVTSCFMMGGTSAVIIQHGNYRTVYSGLSTVNVKKGDKVTAKQTIGTIYTDAEQDNATVLFFQIWQDKDIINPEPWLAK